MTDRLLKCISSTLLPTYFTHKFSEIFVIPDGALLLHLFPHLHSPILTISIQFPGIYAAAAFFFFFYRKFVCIDKYLKVTTIFLCVCTWAVKGPQFIHTGNLRVISFKDEQIKATLPVRGHFIKPSYPQSGHKQTKSQLFSCSSSL